MEEMNLNKSLLDMKKVIIIDDHPILRQGIKKVIEMEHDMMVCAEASSANEAIECINRDKPDLAIVDISLSGNVNGIELIKALRSRYPEIIPIVLTMYDESIYAERALKAGAMGYIMKEKASKNIVHAIRKVLSNDLYISDELSKKLLGKMVLGFNEVKEITVENLTNREFEIFNLIGNGFSTKEIAGKLNLSIFTIESHKKSIKVKLNIKKSSELVKHAIQWNIMNNKK